MVVLLAVTVAGFISYFGWNSYGLVPNNAYPILSLCALLLTCLAWLIPSASAVWAACCTLFKVKGVSRRTAIIIAIVEFLMIVGAIALCATLKDQSIMHISFPNNPFRNF